LFHKAFTIGFRFFNRLQSLGQGVKKRAFVKMKVLEVFFPTVLAGDFHLIESFPCVFAVSGFSVNSYQ
jgi:hypothetical protein